MSAISIKSISKVTPLEIPTLNKNNFITKNTKLVNQFKYIVTLQALVGINRLFLFYKSRAVRWLSYAYNMLLILVTIYLMVRKNTQSSSNRVISNTSRLEFIILNLLSLFSKQQTMEKLFNKLTNFDEALNIRSNISLTTPVFFFLFAIIFGILFDIIEYFLIFNYVEKFNSFSSMFMHIALIAHDSEQIFFCALLRILYLRVCILKAHVVKVLAMNGGDVQTEKLNKVEALYKKTQLDITSLQRVYELLHRCAEQLNSIMSFPMTVLLFTSGLSTTMLLNNLFKIVQLTEEYDSVLKSIVIQTSVRCIKYTILVVVPCYYSSITSTQVSVIRTMLFDVMNSENIDKIERRQVKAFFQMTRDSKFTYAIWGVITLNMSLPLSYSSLCTTYLVIIIQFSKFID